MRDWARDGRKRGCYERKYGGVIERGGWGEKWDGGWGGVYVFGGALLICPLIGLFKRWGRGTKHTHQLYEEREEKQRERWEGGIDSIHFLHTNIQG